MANKVKFEREQVVRAASQLFWEKGFHATSTRDLQDAINMRPGSIYAAFGSKEGLYCEAIKNYAKQMQSLINERLVSCSSILDALQDFVEYVAREDITESQKEEAWSKVPMSWCKQYLWDWRKANPDYNLLLTPPYVVKKNNLN